MKPIISLIVAASQNLVIGDGPNIPWPRLRGDLENFRKKTTPHPIIVGRKTYETFKNRDGTRINLPDRLNIVVTRDMGYDPLPGARVANSLEQAIEIATDTQPEKIWICGGGEIYRQALGYDEKGNLNRANCIVKEIFFTSVMLDVRGDVFFPDFWMEYLTIDQETMLRDDVVEIGGKKQIVGYYIYHLVRK